MFNELDVQIAKNLLGCGVFDFSEFARGYAYQVKIFSSSGLAARS